MIGHGTTYVLTYVSPLAFISWVVLLNQTAELPIPPGWLAWNSPLIGLLLLWLALWFFPK